VVLVTSRPKTVVDVVRAMRSRLIPNSGRDAGDVRRDAALYVARRARTTHSSFAKGLLAALDENRLGSLPYLASLGFLVAAELIQPPFPHQLSDAVARVEKRRDHTDERSGLADDPVCAVGLLLLARALGNQALVRRLEGELLTTEISAPSLRLLASTALGRSVGTAFPAGSNGAHDLAAAMLFEAINASLRPTVFPAAPTDIAESLFTAVASSDFEFAEDFGDMIILAALETRVKMTDGLPVPNGPCDVGIVVPLKEEFRVFFERINGRCTDVIDGGRTYYVFEAPVVGGGAPYRCVVTVMGDMAPTRAGIVAEKLLGRWQPELIVMVGIAGGIHKDVRVGDVIVATQVDNYVEGAKVSDDEKTVRFERTHDSFKSDGSVVDRIRNFEFSESARYNAWKEAAAVRHQALLAANPKLGPELLAAEPEVREGHVASGPVVLVSKNFAQWIKEGDRACLAVEMEAAGMMIAAYLDPKKTSTLVLRGISDLADDRKATLDQIGGGALRTLAMTNVTSLLWALFEAGVLPRRETLGSVERASVPKVVETLEEVLLEVLREHADENAEVTATWAEIRGWMGPTPPGDLHTAAIHLKDDGYFRSHTFAGGSDGVCNVTLRR
jgi:nucleoside phosphorylase